jgi:flagellar biosynthetic protein FliR
MNGMDMFSGYTANFLLILLRVSIFFSLLPLYGNSSLPAQFKIGFIVAMALILTPVVEVKVTDTEIPLLVMREVMFGLVLGTTARLVFFAVDMAGQMMSNAMGLSVATVFNPEMGQSTELANLYGIIAILLFLAMDAHHDLIYVFAKSYEWLPSGQIEINKLIPGMISGGGRMFVIAVKISAPVVVIMLIVNLLLGFMYKAAPQMNVFFVGYPVYIFVGLVVILLSIPVFAHVLGGYFSSIKDEMARVVAMARG